MWDFLLTYAAVISLGIILVIIVRSWPKINAVPGEEKKSGIFERVLLSDIPQKADLILMRFTEKMCRKLKVAVLRTDNYLTAKLKNMSERSNEKPKINFKEIHGASEMASVDTENAGEKD